MTKIDEQIVSDKMADTVTTTAGFPQLRLPNQEIADSGIVRLGNGSITAQFPLNSARKRRLNRS